MRLRDSVQLAELYILEGASLWQKMHQQPGDESPQFSQAADSDSISSANLCKTPSQAPSYGSLSKGYAGRLLSDAIPCICH